MPAHSRIVLCYAPLQEHAYLPEAIAFANAYWEQAPDGSFLRTAESLQDEAQAVFGERTNIRQIANLIATAYAVDLRCPSCGAVAAVDGRYALMRLEKAHAIDGNQPCEACQAAQQKIAAEKAANEHANYIRAHIDDFTRFPTHYEEMPFHACLIAFALQDAIGDRFISGEAFNIHWVENLWAGPPQEMLDILCDQGVIAPSTEPHNLANMSVDPDRGLTMRWDTGEWQTCPQAKSDRFEAAEILKQRIVEDAESVIDLWYSNSVAEGLRYLTQQAAFRGLAPLNEQEQDWIKVTLYDALSVYPLSKIWSAIWRVVCDCEPKVATRTASAAGIVHNIPDRLERLLNDARRGKVALNKAWERPNYLPKSHLTAVFERRFGLNHNSTSGDARAVIEDAARHGEYQANLDHYRSILDDLLNQAQRIGITTEVMFMYGECLRHNEGIDSAIEAIRAKYPALAANHEHIEQMA